MPALIDPNREQFDLDLNDTAASVPGLGVSFVKPPPKYDVNSLKIIAQNAEKTLQTVRDEMLEPFPRKYAPTFSARQVAALCGIEKERVAYLISRGDDLPHGTSQGAGKARVFSLKEAQTWALRHRATAFNRPEGIRGRIVIVGNYKGGVTKTTTAMSLAQALTLRGLKVLAVDMDPQGSLTQLFGIFPSAEVENEETVFEYFQDPSDDVQLLKNAIKKTYWDNLDLIAASPTVFGGDFLITSRLARDPSYKFWTLLRTGLREIAKDYDAIIVDTAPSLSYMTLNAYFAADSLLVPVPPNALDFASMSQFWALFVEMCSRLQARDTESYVLDYINILITKVDKSDQPTQLVAGWIRQLYAGMVLPLMIPKSNVTTASAASFGTVYDVTRWEGSQATYQRIRQETDRLAEIIDLQLQSVWSPNKVAPTFE